VIDFNYLLGWDGEIVVKELAFLDRQDNRVSTYMFKSPMIGKKYQRSLERFL
jgi:hypothetical protein